MAVSPQIWHNIIGFDIPVLTKLTSFKAKGKKIVDTLVASRLFNPSREGGHSLSSWGYRLGFPKIDIEEPEEYFKQYSQEMLDYCVRDVELNTLVFKTLQEEGKGFSKESFELLDSIKHKNILRVYPHKLFCDTLIKDRCVTHDDKNIFYSDDEQPSIKGAEMINELILKEIEKIETKSN